MATQALAVGGHAKVVNLAEAIFSQDISGATYIAYSSDRNVVGFQLNGSADGTMLDGLPGLARTRTYRGTWSSNTGSGGTVRLTVQEQDGSITGDFVSQNYHGEAITGEMTGTVSGSSLLRHSFFNATAGAEQLSFL